MADEACIGVALSARRQFWMVSECSLGLKSEARTLPQPSVVQIRRVVVSSNFGRRVYLELEWNCKVNGIRGKVFKIKTDLCVS